MGNLWVTIPLMKIICCWFLTYFGKKDGRWHLVHFPTCLLALDCSCWELQVLWMIWELVLGRYSQGKVSSETAWSEGLSQSYWAVGKNNQASKSETWKFESLSRTDNGCPKRGNPQTTIWVILRWCSDKAAHIVVAQEEKQKEMVHKKRKCTVQTPRDQG